MDTARKLKISVKEGDATFENVQKAGQMCAISINDTLIC